jgi:hypothetical protein
MSRALDCIHNESAATQRLRPAAVTGQPSPQAAGPFHVASAQKPDNGFGSVLLTGLLVIYPAFATVAAIVVGLSLSSGGA